METPWGEGWRKFGRRTRDDCSRLIAAFACQRPLMPGLRLFLHDCEEVLIGRGKSRRWECRDAQLLVAFPDPMMSRPHARLVRDEGSWWLNDERAKNGTYVNGERVTRRLLTDGDVVELGATLFVYRDAPGPEEGQTDPRHRDLAEDQDLLPEALRALSLEMDQQVLDLIRVAPTAEPVLIEGETGTGKEVVARAVHALSARRGRFVPVLCRGLDPNAFAGHMASAEGGTLFLGWVDDLHESTQVALLRLLDEPDGRDVRVIASISPDRKDRLVDGRFRADLCGRLVRRHVVIPPLRDRREDIGSIVAALLRRIAPDRADLKFETRAAFALMSYSYPLNVRELQAALRSAIGLAGENKILAEYLLPAIHAPGRARQA